MGKERSRVIFLSVLTFLLAVAAFILTVIIWADPKLVPKINDNYNEADAGSEAEPTIAPEPSKEPAAEPSVKLDFGDDGNMGQKDRLYTFGVFTSSPPSSFLNEDGRLQGYFVDIVSRLCREAGKKCRFIGLKTYKTIWDGTNHISEGLLRRFFDAGLQVTNTPERAAGYGYTEPLLQAVPYSAVYTKMGASFVEDDLMTKKIGFLSGFYTSAECLARETDRSIPPANVVTFTTVEDMVAGFRDGNIELAFIPKNVYYSGLYGDEIVEGKTYEDACSNGDVSMLVRKDSPLLGWMSDVTKQMKKRGQYKEMCDELTEKYGTTITCAV